MGNAIWIGQISGKEAIAELRYRKEVVAGIEMRSLRVHSFFYQLQGLYCRNNHILIMNTII